MLTPAFLKAMNGTLFTLLIFAFSMFTLYISREVMTNGFVRARLQAAVSISVFIAGEAVIRGWVWWWRHLQDLGEDYAWMTLHPTLAIGAAIQIAGVVCMIRVFAPDQWGRNVWIISTLVAVGVATVFSSL